MLQDGDVFPAFRDSLEIFQGMSLYGEKANFLLAETHPR